MNNCISKNKFYRSSKLKYKIYLKDYFLLDFRRKFVRNNIATIIMYDKIYYQVNTANYSYVITSTFTSNYHLKIIIITGNCLQK